MSIDLEIRVDTSQPETAGTRGAAAVGKVEDAANRARDAMGRFAKTGAEAGTQVAAGAEAASESLGDLVDKLGGAADAQDKLGDKTDKAGGFSARQLAIIERIKGPLREHREDLDALNELHARGELSMKQYEDELVRLETRYGSAHRAESVLAQSLERESAILERIRGPMREYNADLAALEKLQTDGKITTLEFEAELDRLNRKVGAMHGPISQLAERDAATLQQLRGPLQEYENKVASLNRLYQQGKITGQERDTELLKQAARAGYKPGESAEAEAGGLVSGKLGSTIESIAPQFGPVGNILGGIATKGTVATAAVLALATEFVHLGDEYIKISNAAQKVTAAGADVDHTLATQYDLSLKLHGSLEQTLELYDAVRDGTDELNFSQQQQLQLAKEIGDAVIAEGKGLGAAEGLMRRLTFAFASGTISGRDLRSIMKEFPDIGAAFVDAMGHSRKELVEMANKGQISAEMLIAAFHKMGPEMEEKVGKKAETTGQMWGHFKDQLTLSFGKFAESTGVFETMSKSLQALGETISGITEIASVSTGALQAFMLAAQGVIDAVKTGVSAAGSGIGAAIDALTGGPSDEHKQADVARAYLARLEALKQIGKEEERNARTAELAGAAGRLGIDFGAFDESAANKAAAAQIEMRQRGVEIGDAFATAHAKATLFGAKLDEIKEKKDADDIARDVKRIYQEMNGANDLVAKQLEHWQDLADQVAVTTKAIEKWKSLTPAGVPTSQEQRELQRQLRDTQIEQNDFQYGKGVVARNQQLAQAGDQLRDYRRALKDGEISAEAFRKKYEETMTVLNDGRLPEAIKIWNSIHDPIDQARRDLAALNSLYRQGSLDTRDYVAELKKIAATGKSSDATIIVGGIERFDALLAKGMITLRDYNAQLNKVLDALRGSERMFGGTRVRIGYDLNPHALPSTREADTAAASSAVQKAFADARAQIDAFQASGTGAAKALEELSKNMDLGNQFVAPLVEYETKLKDIDRALHANSLTQQQATFLQRQAREEYDKAEEALGRVKTPLDEYRDAVRHLGEQLESGALSAAKYNDAVGEARVKLLEATGASRTFAGGMEIEWQKLRQEADNAGASIAKMAVDDIGKLSDALVTMASGGEVSFEQMVDSMIQDLERLALRMLEIKLIEAGLNAIFPGAGVVAGASGAAGSVADLVGGAIGGWVGAVGGTAGIPAAAYSTPVTSSASQSVSVAPTTAPIVNIHNHIDESVVAHALTSRAGQRAVSNVIRRTKGLR